MKNILRRFGIFPDNNENEQKIAIQITLIKLINHFVFLFNLKDYLNNNNNKLYRLNMIKIIN